MLRKTIQETITNHKDTIQSLQASLSARKGQAMHLGIAVDKIENFQKVTEKFQRQLTKLSSKKYNESSKIEIVAQTLESCQENLKAWMQAEKEGTQEYSLDRKDINLLLALIQTDTETISRLAKAIIAEVKKLEPVPIILQFGEYKTRHISNQDPGLPPNSGRG